MTKRNSRIRDYIVYIAIGVGLASLMLWSAETAVPRGAVEKWGGLITITGVLFAELAGSRRHLLRFPAFWGVLMLFLVVHLCIWITVLRSVDHWRAIWWVPAFPIEMVAFDLVLQWIGLDLLGKGRNGSDS